MKKLLLPLIFLLLALPGMSQGWVFVNGTVTSLQDSLPVVNHPVTIFADSLNGVIYYNVVYTDSVGYYYDSAPVMTNYPGMLTIQTQDCNNNLQQAFFAYDSANYTFTHDFRICTTTQSCEALFSFYPEPQGSPDSFQFTDMSLGSIYSRFWDFGDGTFSEEQDPYHIFPGPGTFETCLLVIGNNCSDTYCTTIVISDTVYQQIYGQVFSGNFPLQSGTVILFAQDPSGGYYPLREGSPVDSNGIYYFSLVPEGTYLIQAVPADSNGFLPTYFGDVIEWQQAKQVVLGTPENPYNINMTGFGGPLSTGPGSLTGLISTGQGDSSSVDLINMILMHESGLIIGFSSVDNQGYFDFQALDYGTYFLRAELSGVTSDNMRFDITYEKPYVDVVLNYSGNSVLDVKEDQSIDDLLSVYPNPFNNMLTISFSLPEENDIQIDIFSMTGQLVYKGEIKGYAGQNSLDISLNNYPAGIYTLKFYIDGGKVMVKKLIKSR